MSQLLKSRHPMDAEYNVQTLVAISGGGADDFAGADDCAAGDCGDCVVDQRHRDHEHHAGDGAGADAGDWNSQSDWRGAQRNFVPIFD